MGRLFRLVPLVVLAACAHGAPAKAPPGTVAAPKEAKTPAFGPAAIDAALRAEWKKDALVPAPASDDATFLRRAYVDVVGTVPPVEVVNGFLADPAKDKRARLVETLLASPEYAEHWTNYWDDTLMGREAKSNLVDRTAFRTWLHGRLLANAPWDKLVSELLSATGRNGDGGPKTKGTAMQVPMTATAMEEPGPEGDENVPINGAVNWTLRFETTPQDLGGSASRTFLGVQIQCAQCHDHKTEAWKQTDFRKFTSAFFRAKLAPIDRGKTPGVRRVVLEDNDGVQPRFAKNKELAPIVTSKPTALDGTDLAKGAGTRKALAAWMTSRSNPYFAKAFVNRMWGHFLGRGFYDPVDDIRPSNPPVMPELLDRIAADFVAHDFDVKHLVRTICATEAYQLASSAGAKTDAENTKWARFHLVPLGPEELLNAIMRVTDLEHTASVAGVKNIDQLRTNVVRQYAFLFDTDEEDDEPDYSGTVSQALALLNGALVASGTRALQGSVTATIANGPGTDADKVDALAIRALGRHATTDERARWAAYVSEAPGKPAARGAKERGPLGALANKRAPASPKAGAYEDLLWSLLNSSEFTFNH